MSHCKGTLLGMKLPWAAPSSPLRSLAGDCLGCAAGPWGSAGLASRWWAGGGGDGQASAEGSSFRKGLRCCGACREPLLQHSLFGPVLPAPPRQKLCRSLTASPRSAVPGQPQPQLVQPLPPGSRGPRVLWSLPSRHWPWQETGHRQGQLFAEGGSLSSAVWVSACPPWSLGPLPGPTVASQGSSYLGHKVSTGAEWS